MNIVVVGAGALGSIYGGYLANAGYRVTLIGRDPHMKAIHEHGLHVSGRDQDAFIAYPRAVTDAREVKQADLLLLCVRTTDTAQALADTAHLQPAIAASFQNGVGKNEMLMKHLGPGPVVGATCTIGAQIIAPGHVHCNLYGHTWFGELDHHLSPRVQGLVGMWQKAGLPVAIPTSIQSVQWSKLAYLLPLSTLGGLSRLHYHQILQSEDLAYLFVQMVREVGKIAREYDIHLEDYPALSPRTLIDSPFEQSVRFLQARGRDLEASGHSDISTNMRYDLQQGRPTEIEAMAGELVRRARDAGLTLPAISFVYRLIRGIDQSLGN